MFTPNNVVNCVFAILNIFSLKSVFLCNNKLHIYIILRECFYVLRNFL
jgi:hypothetical protein